MRTTFCEPPHVAGPSRKGRLAKRWRTADCRRLANSSAGRNGNDRNDDRRLFPAEPHAEEENRGGENHRPRKAILQRADERGRAHRYWQWPFPPSTRRMNRPCPKHSVLRLGSRIPDQRQQSYFFGFPSEPGLVPEISPASIKRRKLTSRADMRAFVAMTTSLSGSHGTLEVMTS